MVSLASDLLGPVGLALAQAVEQLPGERALTGGSRYELKWDGYLHRIRHVGWCRPFQVEVE